VFGRLLRMHHFTAFHLHDHAKFTLGDPMARQESTLYWQKPAPLRLAAPGPVRILFHLNGGWPLKTYPEKETRALFQALRAFGFELTVIGRPDLEPFGARSVIADSAVSLAAEIEAHHLFVGVDSFPVHFASLVHKRPTIALFGSTRPLNHDAPTSPGYEAMVGYLPCNTCLAKTGCPITGQSECVNYPPAAAVAAKVAAMAAQLYGLAAA
jgi:ADP-heptose:LPS heptosyltransferase